MSKSTIFEYCVVFNPKSKKEGETPDKKPSILVDVTRVLVQNQQEATILAARSIPAEYLDKLDQVEIAVRPF